MWTKLERVKAVLSGERPDRVPIFECVAHDGILEHFGGAPIADDDFGAVVRACSQFLDLCHPALVPRAPQRIASEGGGQQVVERWNTWRVPAPTGGETEQRRSLQTDIEGAEAGRPSAADVAEFRRLVEATNRHADEMVYMHIGTACSVLPFDIEQGIYTLMDHPKLTRRWNRAMNARNLRQLDAIADGTLAPVAICWNDIAFKGRLIYPPEILEELFCPHLAAVCDLLHARGIRVVFHSDGDVSQALPRLVECGIDGFNPLEISVGMDAQTFQDVCGSRVALVGGIDAVEVLARGAPTLVVERTRDLIDRFREAGNLMMASASGEVDNSMPTENVLAMIETTWDYGRY